MDAFEQLISEILSAAGYWVRTSVKVHLTREEKVLIGRHSSPRWELDVVAYKASLNELLVFECKSFLDSTGVSFAELQDGHTSTRYKLFREPELRRVVLGRLATQFAEEGRCSDKPIVRLGMVAGKIKQGDPSRIAAFFRERDWLFFGPDWIREKLKTAAGESYENQVSSVVAKLLLREEREHGSQKGTKYNRLDPATPIELTVNTNPKRPGSKSYSRFEGYFRREATTIEGALSCGVRMDDIRNDLKKGYLRLSVQRLSQE